MNKLFALGALLTTYVAQGQYTYDWAKRLAGNNLDWSYDIAVDTQGNVSRHPRQCYHHGAVL